MWGIMDDGTRVQDIPDGWRLRNPDGTYCNVQDPDHGWALAVEAVNRRPADGQAFGPFVRPASQSWVASKDLIPRALAADMSVEVMSSMLRAMGGTPRKHRGVRGWKGVALIH